MRRPPIEIEQRERLYSATRPEDMGLAAGDEDEIAGGHTERSSIPERDDGRTPAEIVEDRIRKLRQRQTPGTAKLVVEQQGPVQANAIEHVGKNVHAGRRGVEGLLDVVADASEDGCQSWRVLVWWRAKIR
jgi:hypothetical protein